MFAPGPNVTVFKNLDRDVIWIAANRTVFVILLTIALSRIDRNHDFLATRIADVCRLVIHELFPGKDYLVRAFCFAVEKTFDRKVDVAGWKRNIDEVPAGLFGQ